MVTAKLDPRYSDEQARATAWPEVVDRLASAELYWLTTVRTDGRPHVTPLIAVWSDDALHFSTGPGEQKARNLQENPYVALTTGSNALNEGYDIVVGGAAVQVHDDGALRRLAEAFETKYGATWRFQVGDGAFHHDGHTALVFRVAPTTAYGFGKGAFSHTRFSF